MLKILKILKKYKFANSDYLFFAEHDIIGFCFDYNLLSKKDLEKLNKLGVTYNEDYDSLIMFL